MVRVSELLARANTTVRRSSPNRQRRTIDTPDARPSLSLEQHHQNGPRMAPYQTPGPRVPALSLTGMGLPISLRQVADPKPARAWSETQPPNDFYRSRLQRARIANMMSRSGRETEQEAQVKTWQEATKRLEGTTRVSELRTRLSILAQRDESKWGVKEMKAALWSGGIAVDDNTSKAALCGMVKQMAEEAVERWKDEAASVDVMQDRYAGAIEAKKTPQAIARKFRSIGARNHATKDTGRTDLHVEVGESTDEDAASTSRSSSSSYRASFRRLGATHARTQDVATGTTQAKDREPDDLRAMLRSVLVPEFAEETLWAHIVGQCLTLPRCSIHTSHTVM